MCGRFGLSHKKQDIEEIFGIALPQEYAARTNIAPTQPVLIVRENVHRPDGLEAPHVVWGLIPPWADDIKIGQKMFNARSETAAEKPSFRNALRRRRCVVPASGFYEWKAEGPGRKQPYFIARQDGDLLALAGIWEMWDGPNGEQIESCAILTKPADDFMRPLHERMPVMIPHQRIPEWLDTTNEDLRTVEPFFRIENPPMQATPASPLVNNARNEAPPPPADTDLFGQPL